MSDSVIANQHMDYNHPLLEGQFLKRYKRFFAEVNLANESVIAHVPNTGSLASICDEPRLCRLLKSDDPKRKLKFTLEQVKTESSWVGVNTQNANTLGWESFQNQLIPHWQGYSEAVREIKINDSTRLDMKLYSHKTKPDHFVEIKNVTFARNGCALFPDAVTTRGQKHLRELIELKQRGFSTEIFFLIQRTDCSEFSPAFEIDQDYGKLLIEAQKAGVKVSAYSATLERDRITLNADKEIKISLRSKRNQ